MQKLMNAMVSVLIVSLLTLPPAPAAPAKLPGGGKVDEVNLQDGFLLVDDIRFGLIPATRVYTATGSLGTSQQLRKGMRVRINLVEPTGSGRPVISEIQIISGN